MCVSSLLPGHRNHSHEFTRLKSEAARLVIAFAYDSAVWSSLCFPIDTNPRRTWSGVNNLDYELETYNNRLYAPLLCQHVLQRRLELRILELVAGGFQPLRLDALTR